MVGSLKLNRYFKKIIIYIACLATIVVINFFLPRLMPGDPVYNLSGVSDTVLSPEGYEALREELGLNSPLLVQFGSYIKGIFTWDLGWSYHNKQAVSAMIGSRIGNTLQIAIPSIIIATILALVFGLKNGYHQKSGDKTVNFFSIIMLSLPAFFIALILVYLLAFKLRWLPLGSLNSIVPPNNKFLWVLDRIYHLILPVTTVALSSFASKYIMMRNLTANEKNTPYIFYARAKGLTKNRILYKHILPNIAIPFITIVGMNFAFVLSGSMVVETIFSIQGMGALVYTAIQQMDFALMQGCLWISALCACIVCFVCDVICIVFDARLKERASYEN